MSLNASHRLYYAPGLKAADVSPDHKRYPFNLRTLRMARKIERTQGCAYVSSVAGELMRLDGLEPPTRGVEPGTAYSYLAYSANKAREVYARRRRHRRLVSQGWQLGPSADLIGGKVLAILHGHIETKGRLVESGGRGVFLPGRNRINGYRADDLYLKQAA